MKIEETRRENEGEQRKLRLDGIKLNIPIFKILKRTWSGNLK